MMTSHDDRDLASTAHENPELAGDASAHERATSTRFTSTGTLPPVSTTDDSRDVGPTASERAYDAGSHDHARGVRGNRELPEIRARLYAKLQQEGCSDVSEPIAQAQLVGETATARLFIQHVYIRNYEHGGISEVFPQSVLTSTLGGDGKQNVVGICVHWQRENPQVPGTWYENGNQAVVAPPVGQQDDILRVAGEHRDLFVVVQDETTPAPQFALKTHDGGGYINNPEGALALYSTAEHKAEVDGERAAASEAAEATLENRRDRSLATRIEELSAGPSRLGGAMSVVVVRERSGKLVVDETVGVDPHGAVRVINATGRRLDVRTSQLEAGTLSAPRWLSPDKANVDAGDFLVPAGGYLNIADHRVAVQPK